MKNMIFAHQFPRAVDGSSTKDSAEKPVGFTNFEVQQIVTIFLLSLLQAVFSEPIPNFIQRELRLSASQGEPDHAAGAGRQQLAQTQPAWHATVCDSQLFVSTGDGRTLSTLAFIA